MPIVDVDGEAAVVLTKRPATMVHHRGDWVFPGGRVDPETDATSRDAARREADEELGIPADRVEIVGQLDTHGPIVTGFVIEVFVGVIDGSVAARPRSPRGVGGADASRSRASCAAPASRSVGSRRSTIPARAPTAPSSTSTGGDVAGGLASFVLPNGDLLWGTQGEILLNLLDQLVTLRTRRTKGVQA